MQQTEQTNKQIGTGKYRNNTYQDVYTNHYDYVKFLYSIKVTNIHLIAFVKFAKEQDAKIAEVKTEEVKTEEVKTEEIKTEEVKTEEVKTEAPSNNNQQ